MLNDKINLLFDETNDRFCIFPIKDNKIWEFYKSSLSLFWTTDEITLNTDYKDFEKLTKNEKHFIKLILAFFASADGVVNENLCMRFSNEVQLAEARAVYSVQNFIETIHSETYSLLIQSYIKDEEERNELFKSIETIPTISKKLLWGMKWITSEESFATRLIAFSIVEGLFFSGAFCSIFWLKKRGLMPGLTFSNELISRDEGMHTEFAIYLYNTYCDKIDEKIIKDMFEEAVMLEKEFILEALPVRLIGMNHILMSQYIEYVADRLLVQLNYSKLYNTPNSFDFMEGISIEGKTNFFEKRVSEYSLAQGGDRTKAFNFETAEF
jgi:ribonucleotide reductase beta subunit family protein with ferritin-like domain